MRTFPTLIGLLFLTPLLGCPPTDEKEDTAAADTDTDTDTDADTDEEVIHHEPNAALAVDDGDVSTDYTIQVTGTAVLTPADAGTDIETLEGSFAKPDVEWTALAGALTYTSDFEGVPTCDLDVALVGTPYVGTCDGCDFAFEIESSITRDDGLASCAPDALLSFVSDGVWGDPVFAHVDSYVTYYGAYDDALLSGGSYNYYGTIYPGPYFTLLSYEGASFGTFAQTENLIDWSVDLAGAYTDFSAYTEYCGYTYTYYAYDPVVGSGGSGQLDCAGTVTDVWTFEVVEGGTAHISVDTVAANTAFDPAFYVNGPDGCEIGFADDTFNCSFEPLDYQCPAATFEDLAAGTYEVVIRSWDSCTGESAAYDFQVDVTSPA